MARACSSSIGSDRPTASSQRPPAVGAILAGGEGRRIGGAKALVELAGRPLISYPLAAVEAAGLDPVVVAKPGSPLPPLACPTIHEPASPQHPLWGIVTALSHAGERPVVAIGCDMPFVDPRLLAWLGATEEPLVVPSREGRPQPLPGRYEAVHLAPLERGARDERPLRQTIAALRPRLLGEEELARFGEPGLLCFNLNTPADLREAERLAATHALGGSDQVP